MLVRKVSAMTVRDRLGQLLEEVYYKEDVVIIERPGRLMAVLVPPATRQATSPPGLRPRTSRNSPAVYSGMPEYRRTG